MGWAVNQWAAAAGTDDEGDQTSAWLAGRLVWSGRIGGDGWAA